MAATKIADVIVPSIFNPYVRTRTMELSALASSGIMKDMPELNILGQKGGTTIVMPYWNDLTGVEQNLSDSASLTVNKITSGTDVAVLNARGNAWGVNDLSKALSGDDPMAAIGDLVAAFWARRLQAQLISVLGGAFAAASMSGNVSDISALTGGAQIIGGTSTVDAVYKMGDAFGQLTAIAVHSAVMAKLVKDELIVYRANSEGKLVIPTYLGLDVIVDDGMPVATGTYTSYIFGSGAIGYADAAAPVPTETDRDTLAGEDILINRKHYVMHPRGIKWQGTPAGVSPTNVEFAVGTNWLRVYENKAIRIVQFKHKIA